MTAAHVTTTNSLVYRYGSGIPAAYMLSARESSAEIALFLTEFSSASKWRPKVVSIDKSATEEKAIREAYNNDVGVRTCLFHIQQVRRVRIIFSTFPHVLFMCTLVSLLFMRRA